MVNKQKILIVDDDENIAELISLYLTKECFDTTMVHNGEDALTAFDTYHPDLILLDLMLPGIDGYQVCREIRSRSNTPIIMLSAKGEVFDKVLGLELGADDYMVKPFDAKEVVARIKAVLRRSGGPSEPDILEAGGVRLSLSRGTVWASGRTAELTRNELKILAHLMAHAGEIVSRADLIEALWDSRIYIDDNTLSVNVTRLRNKLGELGLPEQIKTRRGMGYQYDDR